MLYNKNKISTLIQSIVKGGKTMKVNETKLNDFEGV